MKNLEKINQLQKILKVLADQKRMRILKLLKKKKMCVCQLAYILEISQPSVSRHLKKMKLAGLIGEEQDSFWTNYYLRLPQDRCVRDLLRDLQGWLDKDKIILNDIKKARGANKPHTCVRKNKNRKKGRT